jgi:hypothetical protein
MINEIMREDKPAMTSTYHATKLWPQYVDALAQLCQCNDITFFDLSSAELTGHCFIDSVHMTDNGYRQIAEELVKLLPSG